MAHFKPIVSFICTHNSARSQMAEALLRHHFGEEYIVQSAGTEATTVKATALLVLDEWGLETSLLYSKTVDHPDFLPSDIVVTVCDDAQGNCPFVPGKLKNIHQAFPDPSNEGSNQEENIAAFRRVRNEISEWIKSEFRVSTSG